jgi:hypothetical protein
MPNAETMERRRTRESSAKWELRNTGYFPVYVIHIGETHTISPFFCSPRT